MAVSNAENASAFDGPLLLLSLLLSSSSSVSSSTGSDSSCTEVSISARDAPLSLFARQFNISSFVSMFKTLRFRFEFEAIAVHYTTKEHVYTRHLEIN
ncbi:UNVERIFIED_CONTAM: hypothetical protein NCL1_47049 [Trichonephila clavipes]